MARSCAVGIARSGRMIDRRQSVALTDATEVVLTQHLCRDDGQEDLCLAVYQPSTGSNRDTALLSEVLLPQPGEHRVYGVVTFTGDYVMRAIEAAIDVGGGVAILHSHPHGHGWQALSAPDYDAESSYSHLVHQLTGLRLLGLTYASQSKSWSARFWSADTATPIACESVRVVGNTLDISWNNDQIPIPPVSLKLSRTQSCWGAKTQADVARLRVLIAGVGTIGLDVSWCLAAAGVGHIGLLDFDLLELKNLDRLREASPWDVWLVRSKVEHAKRVIQQSATCEHFEITAIEGSVCESSSLPFLLDYDLIVCGIDDHPWPRSILSTLAYSDLIPVLDGGVAIDVFDDGSMRSASWRAHTLRPGRPCMACNKQIELGDITIDQQGLRRDADYIEGLPEASIAEGRNVGSVAVGAVAGYLAQFTSLLANPSGIGDPGPVQFSLSTHWLEHLECESRPECPIEAQEAVGDKRLVMVGDDHHAREVIGNVKMRQRPLHIRLLRFLDAQFDRLRSFLDRWVEDRIDEKRC